MTDRSMTAIVEYQIRAEHNSMEEWLSVWDLRGEDARVGEPEMLAYATAVNLEDQKNVLVFERYADGTGSLQKHMERKAHADLLTTTLIC